MQELARDLGRSRPALYLALATVSIAKSAFVTWGRTPDSIASSPVPAYSKLSVPPVVSDAADVCCLPRAATVSAAVTGQQQVDACKQQLASLLHASSTHVGMQIMWHQNSRKYQQYLQHSYFDDSKRLLLFGCSIFALYTAQPNKQAWHSLMQRHAVPNELSTAEKPYDMLLPRASAAQPMQPKWVPRCLCIQCM